MKNRTTKQKWDAIAKLYKWNQIGVEKRWEPWKRKFFSHMDDGKILFLAVGIGSEFRLFPSNRDIVGIDISSEMLKRAAPLAEKYQGKIELNEMDARKLTFPDATFDQVFSSCTFCSVPDPINGLKEIRRILKPGGELRMFEHTNSRLFPFKQFLYLMNPIAEKIGPSVNRDTVSNVISAGFTIKQVYNIYLDIVKTIFAVAP